MDGTRVALWTLVALVAAGLLHRARRHRPEGKGRHRLDRGLAGRPVRRVLELEQDPDHPDDFSLESCSVVLPEASRTVRPTMYDRTITAMVRASAASMPWSALMQSWRSRPVGWISPAHSTR